MEQLELEGVVSELFINLRLVQFDSVPEFQDVMCSWSTASALVPTLCTVLRKMADGSETRDEARIKKIESDVQHAFKRIYDLAYIFHKVDSRFCPFGSFSIITLNLDVHQPLNLSQAVQKQPCHFCRFLK